MVLKAHPWNSYSTRRLWWIVNLRRAPQLLKQTFLVSKQNERPLSSASQTMRRARLVGPHIHLVVLRSSFGTLIRSKKSLGCIHTRSGMQGVCSMYMFKSCGRKGFSWAFTSIGSRASTPSLPLPRRFKLALEASATTTGYPHFPSRFLRLPRLLPFVIPPRCNLFGVGPPTPPRQPRRVFRRLTNRQETPSRRQRPHLRLYSPTETRVHLSLRTFPSPAPVRAGRRLHDSLVCLTCSPSARVGDGSRVRCGWKRWASWVRMDSPSSHLCLRQRSSA